MECSITRYWLFHLILWLLFLYRYTRWRVNYQILCTEFRALHYLHSYRSVQIYFISLNHKMIFKFCVPYLLHSKMLDMLSSLLYRRQLEMYFYQSKIYQIKLTESFKNLVTTQTVCYYFYRVQVVDIFIHLSWIEF